MASYPPFHALLRVLPAAAHQPLQSSLHRQSPPARHRPGLAGQPQRASHPLLRTLQRLAVSIVCHRRHHRPSSPLGPQAPLEFPVPIARWCSMHVCTPSASSCRVARQASSRKSVAPALRLRPMTKTRFATRPRSPPCPDCLPNACRRMCCQIHRQSRTWRERHAASPAPVNGRPPPAREVPHGPRRCDVPRAAGRLFSVHLARQFPE